MSQRIPESDWKVFRKLRGKALERFCERVLSDIRRTVLTFINTVTFVGSATEPRSRRDDESMQGHRRGGATKRWARPAPSANVTVFMKGST